MRIYFKIISQDIKSKMSYRADFIISTFGMMLSNAAGFVSFWILFRNFPSIAGWQYEEVLFLYSFSLLAMTPQQCLFDNSWNLRRHVYSGDFIKYCFRPLNLFFYYISETFDLKGLGQLAVGIAAMLYSWNMLGLGFDLLLITQLIVMLVSASFFYIAITTAASATCFWFVNSGFVLFTVTGFLEYARYPVVIFNKVLQFFFTFIVPIAFVAYYPSLLFLRPEEISVLTWFTPALGAVFFGVSYLIWMKGAVTYSGTGS